MKCPYRTIKRETVDLTSGLGEPVTTTDFADCYGTECPFYKPPNYYGSLSTEEGCRQVEIQEKNANKEKK